MKKAFITLMCLIAMMAAGTVLKAQEISITLIPGWTWISNPSTDTLDFATALGSFTPMQGDAIKSQWGNAYYRNGRWAGNISQFYPGYGYKYYSNRNVPVMLTFNVQQSTQQVAVTTSEPMLITAISAMGGGEVTTTDGTYIIVKGLCWATHENPTTNDDFYQEAESGVGSFSLSMTGLNISTTYYVRAYAVTPNGTVYGNQKTFTTRDGIPEVSTDSVTDILGNGATCGGTVTDNGGLSVTARGVCWSIFPNPTVADSHTADDSGMGGFTSYITELNVSTAYYVRAYATTAAGTAYGEEKVFTTRDGIPIVTTDVTNIGISWAYSGGNITDNGGLNITARGVCWSTSPDPTVADSHINDYSDSFTSYITGLNASTTYYVRAYASTIAGTGYGEQKSFTTFDNPSQVWVDFGLPSGTLWAACNVGADTPEGYGDYFAWGETQPKNNYSWSTYQYCNGSYNTLTKYCNNSSYGYNGFTDNLTTLQPIDDAATINWGNNWRMPTMEEWGELFRYTSSFWTYQNGVEGWLFTASNGNRLFLPFAEGYYGDYWSSSLNTDAPDNAKDFSFYADDGKMRSSGNRRYGLSVRAVRSKSQSITPTGAITGMFSVSEDSHVCFSQGNLQYQASTDTWRFAENQYDYIGDANSNISSSNNDWIDLFGWGTSGYDHGAVCYQPWSTSQTDSDYYVYGSSTYNLYDQTGQADWGYNPISNGSNIVNRWRTLTEQEWQYVFDTRTTASGIRYAKAKVNNVNGVILLPDNWNSSTFSLSNTNSSSASFSSNTISAAQWILFENFGAVFLPAAGYRNGTSVSGIGSYGRYWSASYNNNGNAYHVYFNNSDLYTNYSKNRCRGRSVRLVCYPSFIIDANAIPTCGGEVSGGGTYQEGVECTLTAMPNERYTFTNWTENDSVVSTNATYTFLVRAGRMLKANFSYSGNSPTGAINGLFSVSESQQVWFSQGNLQYQASTNIWRFAENQYNHIGNDNSNISSTYSGWIDLFGWGTSGYHDANDPYNVNYQPWSISKSKVNSSYNYFGYGPSTNMIDRNLTGTSANYDWGVYNPISNGGNTANQWRTLTQPEWNYVFNTRSTTSGIRYAKANVNNVNGVILLPDDWSSSTYSLSNTNSDRASFSSNTISSSQWTTLEQAGAVFLPAAGYRDGTSVYNVGSLGYYWSASCYGSYNARLVGFNDGSLFTGSDDRYYGRSVRLVCVAE